jgi:hypothetical protein
MMDRSRVARSWFHSIADTKGSETAKQGTPYFRGGAALSRCRRSPCDAHHLKFAQPRSLGRKVSDEFTVPLCRHHHQQLHRNGSEVAWWADLQIAPLEVARDLWQATLLGSDHSTARTLPDSGDREQGAERSQRDNETREEFHLGSEE